LAQAIEQGIVELSDVLDLTEQEIQSIQDEILSLPEEQANSLKPVYEALGETYDQKMDVHSQAELMKKLITLASL
jgi:ATP-dependent DNA helicase RecQ